MAEVIARVIAEDGKPEGGLVELSNGETNLNGRVAAVSENEFLVNWEDGARTVENQSDYELVVEARTAAAAPPKGHIFDEPHDIGNAVETTIDLEVPQKFQQMHARTAQENPAQPAGWAVPPMDANAYPGGELMAIEQQKRGETAQWEDAQNRPPVDAENPAQPAGFAVPPATGAPIPGQGADGLMQTQAHTGEGIAEHDHKKKTRPQTTPAVSTNPASEAGKNEKDDAVTARVYADDVTGENGTVELQNGNLRVAGKILASDDETFIVEWEDERRTVESKADYDLVVTATNKPEESRDESDFLKKPSSGSWSEPDYSRKSCAAPGCERLVPLGTRTCENHEIIS